MFCLRDVPVWVTPVVIVGVHCLHARLYTWEQLKQSVRRPRAVLEGAVQTLVFLFRCLCRPSESTGDRQRSERLRIKVQALRDEQADHVARLIRELLTYVLSIVGAMVCGSWLLKMTSVGIGLDLLDEHLFVFFLWYATSMYLVSVLYFTGTLFESRFICKADALVTAHVIVFIVATLLSHDAVLPSSVQRLGCGFVPCLYMKRVPVLLTTVSYAALTYLIGMGSDPDAWPLVIVCATLVAWAGNKVLEAYCEAGFQHQQLQGVRGALDAFMTAAYDAVVCLDTHLRIRGAAASLGDFLKLQHLLSLDTVQFLDFVDQGERQILQGFFSQQGSVTKSSIAATCNLNILLGDGSVVRSQVFHCMDDDLRNGLTHWVALRRLETMVPASTGTAASVGSALGPQLQQGLDGASHRTVSEASVSSVSSGRSCADFLDICSMTLRLDASQDDLPILSLQADLRQAGACPPIGSSIGLQDLMVTEDWNRLRDWFNESRRRLHGDEDPDILKNVSLGSCVAGVTLISTEAALAPESAHDADIFTLTLHAPLAMPMSKTQRRAMRKNTMKIAGASSSPRVLGRIDEDRDDHDGVANEAPEVLAL
eukprot:TRINITY_DN17587_c0_g2_i1.p1 TRINITY_DN17587_c0_g2~~TRINITY_DN17587_c0_g2_i1.p1  ORF type:complete len:596 (-),score=64.41 TRINITY_DN17587_c0_g2_i1:59-1846(-)